MESLSSQSVLPPDTHTHTPMGQTGVKKILPDISFIVAFIASECIKRYWETISGQSK